MAGNLQSLSSLSLLEIQKSKQFKYSIIVSNWNAEITKKLEVAAIKLLQDCGVEKSQILISSVPGSFELPLAAKWAIQFQKSDVVICLGCIVQGETKHDEIIANAIAQQILELNISSEIPVIFGVLTVNNMQQAEDRAGGKFGNKGEEAVVAAIKMLVLKTNMQTKI